jgi:hypothetical protein
MRVSQTSHTELRRRTYQSGQALRFTDGVGQRHHSLFVARVLIEFALDQVLDALIQLHVVLSDESDGASRAAGTSGATDAMDVIFTCTQPNGMNQAAETASAGRSRERCTYHVWARHN